MNKIISVLLLFAALVSTNVFAADGCTNPKKPYDQTYCMAKLFLESDSELNQAYNNLMSVIPSDVKKQLVTAERNWIHYRDNSCTMGGTIDVSCNFQVNKARLEYLQDRIRECKTGHCQNQLVVNSNFDSPT